MLVSFVNGHSNRLEIGRINMLSTFSKEILRNTAKKTALIISGIAIMTMSGTSIPVIAPIVPVYADFSVATDKDISIYAQAGIVMDFETGKILYEKNIEQALIPASITKIMVAYIVFEEIAAGNITFDSLMTVSANATKVSQDVAIASYGAKTIPTGSEHTVDALLQMLFVPSAGEACVIFAENIEGSEENFVKRMNETAKRLGMVGTEYTNCHGSYDHYTNALSQAILIRDFMTKFPNVLDYTSLKSTTFNGRTYTNTNKFYSSIPYERIDGFKTGTTTGAGYCLSATLDKEGHRLISVVLKSTSTNNRYYDTQNILEHSYSLLRTNSLIYDGIGTSEFRSDIENFYRLGYSPYDLGDIYPETSLVKTSQFISILDMIADDFDLSKRELKSIDLEEDYTLTPQDAINIINQYIPVSHVANFHISSEEITKFDYGVLAKTVTEVINYINENPDLIIRNSDLLADEIIFDEPKLVNLPFEFSTYSSTDENAEILGTYNDVKVEVVSIKNDGFWNVNIDGNNTWIKVNGDSNFYYSSKKKALYDTSNSLDILGIISPQFIFTEEDINNKDYVRISTWLGDAKIDTRLLYSIGKS